MTLNIILLPRLTRELTSGMRTSGTPTHRECETLGQTCVNLATSPTLPAAPSVRTPSTAAVDREEGFVF